MDYLNEVHYKPPKTRELCCFGLETSSMEIQFLKTVKMSVGPRTNFVLFDICSPTGTLKVNGKTFDTSLFTEKEPLISILLDWGPIELEKGTKAKLFFNETFRKRMKYLRSKPLKGKQLYYNGGTITETKECFEGAAKRK